LCLLNKAAARAVSRVLAREITPEPPWSRTKEKIDYVQ